MVEEHKGMPVSHWERHRAKRIGWLRAAVLGANDGILSTAAWCLVSPPRERLTAT